jgi:DNA-binding Xre family transcriptional regulator
MVMINKLKEFFEARGETTAYGIAKRTGIPRPTIVRLLNDPKAYPSIKSQDIICKTFNAQPGDFLAYMPDDELSTG